MTEKLEAGKGGSPAAAPAGAAKPKSKWFGVKNGLAVAVGVASVAALLFARNCGPEAGQDRPAPAPVASAPAVVQNNCPQPTDQCNLELGEHDPYSPVWAPQKCGYCGDNIQQTWETVETCPVDFHCGDGVCQQGTNIYGAFVAPTTEGGRYALGTVEITESGTPNTPNYCEADCGRPAGGAPAPASSDRRRDRRRDTATPGPAASTTAPPRTSGGRCESEITSRFMNRVSSSLLGNAAAARNSSGAPDGTTVRAVASISVDNGVPRVTAISLSCSGCSGGALSPGTISLGGIPLAPGTNCQTSVSVNIPPG